jgi:hypothetical protein
MGQAPLALALAAGMLAAVNPCGFALLPAYLSLLVVGDTSPSRWRPWPSPPIAAIGPTAAQAREQGFDSETRVLPLAYVPRAVVNRDTRGLVKLVADRGTGRLLGVQVIAEGVGEVIAAAGYALQAGMTVQALADT